MDGVRYNGETTFADELDAYAYLAGVRKAIKSGEWEPPKPKEPEPQSPAIPTVGEMVRIWLEITKPNVRNSTFKAYQEMVQIRVLGNERLCRVRVDELSRAHVADWWRETVAAYPLNQARNSRAYQKLRAAMQLAVDYGYISSNPVYIRASLRATKAKQKELPETKDLKAILHAMPHRYKLITVLVLFHGLRLGEALGLKGQHVNVNSDSASVRIEGNLVRVPKQGRGVKMELHPPKTNAGYRTVPILKEFLPYVRDHIATYQPGDNQFVTVTESGAPVFDTSYRSRFSIAKAKAGVTAEITPHYGRNWLITKLAESGATPKEIGRVLGQEDTATIVGVYMKVRESRPGELMGKVNLD